MAKLRIHRIVRKFIYIISVCPSVKCLYNIYVCTYLCISIYIHIVLSVRNVQQRSLHASAFIVCWRVINFAVYKTLVCVCVYSKHAGKYP